MLSPRTLAKVEIIAAASSFALIFVAGAIRYVALGAGASQQNADLAAKSVILLLLFVFGFSCIGLMIHVFVSLQIRIGNSGLSLVRLLADHEVAVTFMFWGFLSIGCLIALPFALADMGWQMPFGRSEGVLMADIGMTVDEVKQHSTIKIKEPRNMPGGSRMAVEQMVFEYQLGNVHFPQSRYYWLETAKGGDPHIAVLNIGITPRKLPKPEFDAFQHRIQQQLLGDGWMPGHFIAKSQKTVRLWGGKRTSGDGRYWAKGNTVIILETSRMDEEKRDEPPGSGEFILALYLRPKSSEPELVFEPSAWRS